MSLPVPYKRMKETNKWLPKKLQWSEKKCLGETITWLIDRLYVPVSLRTHSYGTKAGSRDIEKYKMNEDAINWGDLGIASMERMGNAWSVTIEEASPDAYHLKEYLLLWLKRWGWNNVVIATEW